VSMTAILLEPLVSRVYSAVGEAMRVVLAILYAHVLHVIFAYPRRSLPRRLPLNALGLALLFLTLSWTFQGFIPSDAAKASDTDSSALHPARRLDQRAPPPPGSHAHTHTRGHLWGQLRQRAPPPPGSRAHTHKRGHAIAPPPPGPHAHTHKRGHTVAHGHRRPPAAPAMPGLSNAPSYDASYASYDDTPSYEEASYDDTPSYEEASYDDAPSYEEASYDDTSYDDGEGSARSSDAKDSGSGPLSALAGPLVFIKAIVRFGMLALGMHIAYHEAALDRYSGYDLV